MAVDAQKLIVPGHGTVFQAAQNAKLPENPLEAFKLAEDGPEGWSNLGHTSKQNTISFSREGGESTSVDTFLADAVRTVYSSVAWQLSIAALQIDEDILDLAFNGDWDPTTNGYIVPGSSSPVGAGLFVLTEDNTGKLGFWIPNTTVTLGDAPAIDTENFFEVPLTAAINSVSTDVMPAANGKPGIMQVFKTGLSPAEESGA